MTVSIETTAPQLGGRADLPESRHGEPLADVADEIGLGVQIGCHHSLSRRGASPISGAEPNTCTRFG
jgi:hypothetical protein